MGKRSPTISILVFPNALQKGQKAWKRGEQALRFLSFSSKKPFKRGNQLLKREIHFSKDPKGESKIPHAPAKQGFKGNIVSYCCDEKIPFSKDSFLKRGVL